MKRKLILATASFVMTKMLNSCYASTVCVGNVKPNNPTIRVNQFTSHHLICGLVSLTNPQKATDYVNGKTYYMIKAQHTFVDGLLECITLGIYNPTTTTFYGPIK